MTKGLPHCNCSLGASGSILALALVDTIKAAIATTSAHAGTTGQAGVFAGNYDLHSCIHAHWALLSLCRTINDRPNARLVLSRLSDSVLRREWDFMRDNPQHERPYGHAWYTLLLGEIAQHPGRNTQALRTVRAGVERDVTAWLDSHRADASVLNYGQHSSWLFSYLLLQLSAPIELNTRARMRELYTQVVAAKRSEWRRRAVRPGDFMHLPSIIDSVDILRGTRHQLTTSNLPTSRAPGDSLSPGHQVGEEMTRIWPVALLACRDRAMCRILRTRINQWEGARQHWQFGPREPAQAWESRFINNSHWTPQFLWMAMWLRC